MIYFENPMLLYYMPFFLRQKNVYFIIVQLAEVQARTLLNC